ncbi:hypothetical protein DPV92_03230 [Haemophilus paraphrohaemolyticus]|uniref:Bro-N domain-containing protein n=1 Tax=Haemophilus paraphrohaemolyticus TaxID=736 RepID=A0A369ZPB9_9PAST|nr:Bro-N domain-containing protein [Haemophilus paraphrohaemolyticus]RDF11283.1 hypothetical protein DPV92_03230 [Haemophilus paraphrohaemolyticus]
MKTQSQLSTFNFESNSIRTLAINNEPWFVAVDICRALNLSSPSMAIANLDDDEKYTLSLTEGIEGVGKQVQELNLVSESGMYTLILRCRDAVKKGSVPHRFRKWVTAEVLPAIRKTGSYSQNASQIQPLADEPLKLLVQAYHFLYQASDLRTKVQPTFIGIDIDRHFGSHYLHNLGKPLSQCMENIQAYIHASAERLMFVQGMASLLETPTAKKAVFK